MRLQEIVWLALFATIANAADEQQSGLWSWTSNTEETNKKQNYAIESNIPSGAENVNFNQTADVVLNVDDVIETILSSNRQGRNLDGFDEVYSDPTVQDALQKGDDTQARNLIKEKLCSLGLMQCDNVENVEGKRPFLPGEFIYAHPPNGPYRGPPRPPHGSYQGQIIRKYLSKLLFTSFKQKTRETLSLNLLIYLFMKN